MIERYTIKPAPALKHVDILKKLAAGEQPGADDLAKLSKVMTKLEIVGDYAYMESVRDLLKALVKA